MRGINKNKRKQGLRWSHMQAMALLDLWQQKIELIRRGANRSKVFAEIKQKLQQNGINVETSDIRTKIDTFTRKYKFEVERVDHPSMWIYFDKMSDILGSTKGLKCENLTEETNSAYADESDSVYYNVEKHAGTSIDIDVKVLPAIVSCVTSSEVVYKEAQATNTKNPTETNGFNGEKVAEQSYTQSRNASFMQSLPEEYDLGQLIAKELHNLNGDLEAPPRTRNKRQSAYADPTDLLYEIISSRKPNPVNFLPTKPASKDHLDHFFVYLDSTMRTFPPLSVAKLKLKMSQLVGEEEILLTEQNQLLSQAR